VTPRSLHRQLLDAILVVVLSGVPARALAQDATQVSPGPIDPQALAPQAPAATPTYEPIAPSGRVYWVVDGIVGFQSLGVGLFGAAWDTAFNSPEEWGQTRSGLGKRYLQRFADVAISNTLEAGVGSLWGEEPRYVPSRRKGIWPRGRYATKTVFLAQRPDGHLAPAWGRYVGNTLNNVIENAWLPPSATTPRQTVIRSATGFLSRLGGNLFDEFWPDVQRWLSRHR
jgi:hypothetical protein